MALNIKLTEATGSANYHMLQVEKANHSYTRTPKIIPPPAQDGAAPSNITMDYGECLQQISIAGVIEDTADLANHIPSKANMEDAVRTWWARGNDVTKLPLLDFNGVTYKVHIKSANFRQQGGITDRWDFEIVFVVRE